jgi:hypothetical protein
VDDGLCGDGGWMGEAELIGGGGMVGGRIRTLISTTSGRRRTLISKRLSTLISKTGTAGYVGYVGIDGVRCPLYNSTGDLQQVGSNR